MPICGGIRKEEDSGGRTGLSREGGSKAKSAT